MPSTCVTVGTLRACLVLVFVGRRSVSNTHCAACTVANKGSVITRFRTWTTTVRKFPERKFGANHTATHGQWWTAPFFKQHYPRGSCGYLGPMVLVGKTAYVCFLWHVDILPTCTLLPSPHHPANFPYAQAGKAKSLWEKNPAGGLWLIYASSVYLRWGFRSCSFYLFETPGQKDRPIHRRLAGFIACHLLSSAPSFSASTVHVR